ncbi:MAG: LysM peptidoglycan-binding domain-containing protein [Isosphaeraceae bacterium]|nr:LysM peptidoglycan-binding domain-containing protein [Isosphaeraceae bacterium]
MSNPAWTPPAPEFITPPQPGDAVTHGEGSQTEHDGTDSDRDTDVLTHSVAHGRPRKQGGSGLRLPREARVGVAVTLSFALLVTLLLLNRGTKGKTPPVTEIHGGGDPKAPADSKSDPKAVADAKAEKPSEPATKQSDSAGKPSGEGSQTTDKSPSGAVVAESGQGDQGQTAGGAPPPAVSLPAAKEATAAQVPAPASNDPKANEGVPAPAPAPVSEATAGTEGPNSPSANSGGAQPVPAPVVAATGTDVSQPASASPVVAPLAPVAAETAVEPNTIVPATVPAALPAPPQTAQPGGGEAVPAPAGSAAAPVVTSAPGDTGGAPLTPPASSAADTPAAPSNVGAPPATKVAAPASSPPISPPSEMPNVAAETSPIVTAPTAAASPEPVTQTQSSSPATTPAAEPAAATAGSGQVGWVKLRNTRFRNEQDDRSATLTTRAESGAGKPDETAALESADKIEPIPHVVQKDENFWTISRLYYRSGRYYKALWAANRDKVPDIKKLIVGTTIRIPPHEELDPSLIDPPTPQRVERSSASTVPLRRTSRPVLNSMMPDRSPVKRVVPEEKPPLPASDSFEEGLPRTRPIEDVAEEDSAEDEPERPRRPRYQVRSRYETLRSIAKATLGDAHREDEILRLNRKVVPDPYHLTPGQYLELPADARTGGLNR